MSTVHNTSLEEGEIITPYAIKKSRKRSYSAEPSTIRNKSTRKRKRRRSLSPINDRNERNSIHHNKYYLNYFDDGMKFDDTGYGLNIPGKIVSIADGVGWIYSNYKKRNQCYKFIKQIGNNLLFENQFVYFDHNGMTANNIRITTVISSDKIKNQYMTANNLSIDSQNIYILNTQINVNEDKCHEFKYCAKGFHFDILLKYMNAFINTDGGYLYFGIDDNGIINGVEYFDRNWQDRLLCHIDSHLKRWEPKKYYNKLRCCFNIKFIQIVQFDDVNNIGYIMPNRVVVRVESINVYNENKKKIMFSDSLNKSWFKLQASIEPNQ